MNEIRNNYDRTDGKLRDLSSHLKKNLNKRIVTSEDVARPIFDGRSMHISAKTTPDHSRIAKRAYAIWQDEGCPTDQEKKHWLRAEVELIRSI